MTKPVHKPIRECICCGEKFPKNELLRIVKNESGIHLDTNGKQEGRGAYLCQSPICAQKLVKQKRLISAFRQAVADEVYDEIERMLLAK